MKEYTDLFNGITDAIEALASICEHGSLPLEDLRKIGIIMENLKQAQIVAENHYISR